MNTLKIVLKDSDNFQEVVLKQGFTKRGLGRAIGTTGSYAIQIINGDRNPGPAIAKKIHEALNVGFDDIFFIQDGHKSEQNTSCAQRLK